MKTFKLKRPYAAALLLLSLPLLHSCVRTNMISHDPEIAATAAESFAKVAFIDKDYKKAHGMFSSPGQVPYETMVSGFDEYHSNYQPTTVRATDFEPIPGQKAMRIHLVGTKGEEKIYYLFTMAGDTETGYKVASTAFRGGDNGPPPPSDMKEPLPKRAGVS